MSVGEHKQECRRKEVANKLTGKAVTEISVGLASVTCCTELHGVTCQQTAICSQGAGICHLLYQST